MLDALIGSDDKIVRSCASDETQVSQPVYQFEATVLSGFSKIVTQPPP